MHIFSVTHIWPQLKTSFSDINHSKENTAENLRIYKKNRDSSFYQKNVIFVKSLSAVYQQDRYQFLFSKSGLYNRATIKNKKLNNTETMKWN